MKKKFLAIVTALIMILTLAACGGGSSSMAKTEAVEAPAAMEEGSFMDMSTSSAGGYVEQPQADIAYETAKSETTGGQKLIRTAWLEMETTAFDEAVQGLMELTEDFDGYFETSTITNRRSGSRWADYTIRVPAAKYTAFLSQVGELCHVTRQEATQEDISEAYYDTQGRLKTQQIKLERLQNLLAEAELMEDIITIESAISETEWQIDNLSGTLRHYDGKVDYATVYVNLQEVYKLSNVEEVPDTFGDRMGDAFNDGLSDFGDTLEDLAVGFAYSWIWWLLLAVVIVIVIRVVRKRSPRLPKLGRKKKTDKQDEG